MNRSTKRRSAFTLLEVLLAMAIGLLLLSAVYVTMEMQLRHVRTGREQVEQSVLVRALLTRMGNDITTSLGPVPPVRTGSANGSSAAGAAGSTSGTTGTTGAAGSSNTSAASSSSSGTSSSSSTTTSGNSLTGPVQFNLGVQGTNNQVSVYVSRVPRELNWTPSDPSNPVTQQQLSDLRRITYWIAGGGGDGGGLARQEVKVATSDDALTTMPPDIPDETSYVIAEEVRSLEISYFDGTNWQQTWDGTTPGTDGVTPMGPPLAIQIRVGIRQMGATNDDDLKYYTHVVQIPTANGLPKSQTSTGQ